MLRRLAVQFLRPHKRQLGQLAVLEVVQTGCAIALPWLSGVLVDRGVAGAPGGEIARIAGAMLLALIVQFGCAVLSCVVSASLSADISGQIREAVFAAALRLPSDRFRPIGTASLITRTVNDVQQVYAVFLATFSLFVSAPLLFLWAISFAIAQDARLSAVILALVSVLAVVLGTLLRIAVQRSRAMQEKLDQVGRIVREQISGVRVIRSLNKSGYELSRLLRASEDLRATATRAAQVSSILLPTTGTIVNVFAVPLLWFAGQQAGHGGIPIGVVVAFVSYLAQILAAATLASFALLALPRAAASIRRIQEVIESAADQPPTSLAPIRDIGELLATTATRPGWVIAERVGLRFAEGSRPVLSDVSFAAEPASFTGVVGVTGSGKSTLLSVLARLTQPTQGQVNLNLPLSADPSSAVGYTPQETVLFSGSIAENLRLARPDASDDELRQALELAQAEPFVRQLDGGLQAQVQQGGRNFSGGQRQRLAIARLIVGRYAVCLLDDPFSALDLATTAQVLAGLRSGCAAATIVLASQRISTLYAADSIIVLDEGQVVARGRHQELLSAVPLYRELARLQSTDVLASEQSS